jgi:hypothetical protein
LTCHPGPDWNCWNEINQFFFKDLPDRCYSIDAAFARQGTDNFEGTSAPFRSSEWCAGAG